MIALNFWPRGKGIWAMMKPENRFPTAVNKNMLNIPCTFYFIMLPIMSGFIMAPIGLAAASFLFRYPSVALQK